jgi:hypothetical protein
MTIISMLFKGTLGDEHVYQCDFDGSGWSTPAMIPEMVTGTHPMWVRYYDQTLFTAWRAVAPTQAVATARYDGPNHWAWFGQNPPGAFSSAAPAAAPVPGTSGKLLLAWKGQDADTSIHMAVFDSLHWSASSAVPGAFTSHSPAAGAFDNQVHLVWKGVPGDHRIYHARFDGVTWSTPQAISGCLTSSQPALATYQGRLVMAWRGAQDDPAIYWASLYPGSGWAPGSRILSFETESGPALLEFSGRLHLVFRGVGNDSALYMANWDGDFWWAAHRIPGAESTSSPTIAEFDPAF